LVICLCLKINYKLPVENVGSNVTIALGLFPRAADEIATRCAEQTGFAVVIAFTADSGGGLSGHSNVGLVNVKFNFKYRIIFFKFKGKKNSKNKHLQDRRIDRRWRLQRNREAEQA